MPIISAAWKQTGSGKGRGPLIEQKRRQGSWLHSKLRMLRGLHSNFSYCNNGKDACKRPLLEGCMPLCNPADPQ